MARCFLISLLIKIPLHHLFQLHPVYPPKTKNHKVFWSFDGVENGCIGNNWIKRGKGILILKSCVSSIDSFYLLRFSKGFYEEAVVLLEKAIRGEKSNKSLYLNRGGMRNSMTCSLLLRTFEHFYFSWKLHVDLFM